MNLFGEIPDHRVKGWEEGVGGIYITDMRACIPLWCNSPVGRNVTIQIEPYPARDGIYIGETSQSLHVRC